MNSRIVNNTAILYARTLINIFLSLYTTRAVLAALGAESYGIYTLLAGLVTAMGFLGGALSMVSQRELCAAFATDENTSARKFRDIINIHAILAMTLLIIIEVLGQLAIKHVLSLQDASRHAAQTVHHFLVAGIVANTVAGAYVSYVLARERADLYAKVGLLEAILRLAFAFVLENLPSSKMVAWAIGNLFISIGSLYSLKWICNHVWPGTRYQLGLDLHSMRELARGVGWNAYGNASALVVLHGTGLFLNIFLGPVANAARALANQISGTISTTTSSLQTALAPVVYTAYARSEYHYVRRMVCIGSKYSAFVYALIAFPLIWQMDVILELWLKNVPVWASDFCRLALFVALIDSISPPLMSAAQATGKIKLYQLAIGTLQLLNLPMSYYALLNGADGVVVYWIAALMSALALVVRLQIIAPLIGLQLVDFRALCIYPIGRVALALSVGWLIFAWALRRVHPLDEAMHHLSIVGVVVGMFLLFVIIAVSMITFGMSREERTMIFDLIFKKVRRNND